jgi:hypothetical protein
MMADSPKLHPAERQIREDYASSLEDQANVTGLEPAIARAVRDKARAIRGAIGILDFKRALAVLNDSLDDGPQSGLDAIDYRHGVEQAKRKLSDANPFPPDLEHAVDAALLRGENPDTIDLYAVTGIPNPNPDAVKSTKRQVTKEYIEARVAAEVRKPTAGLDDLKKGP